MAGRDSSKLAWLARGVKNCWRTKYLRSYLEASKALTNSIYGNLSSEKQTAIAQCRVCKNKDPRDKKRQIGEGQRFVSDLSYLSSLKGEGALFHIIQVLL